MYGKARKRIQYWLARRLPTCRAIVPVLSQSLDRPLTLRERLTMRLHLWTCIYCTWYLEQIGMIGSECRGHGEEPAPDPSLTLSSEARDRIRRAIEESR